ncbi:hypothetical protein BANRA_02778 [Acinetobacter baumannii]|nr:hypothetical protein BANRA_02778 [Acinetobacter baumannii]
MALVGNHLYVANTDSLMRFPYQEGETHITSTGTKVLDLPGGPLNHHWTKMLLPIVKVQSSTLPLVPIVMWPKMV